ncbi:MAG TPA: M48 family metalloprotease [Kofleriaceae bacterium]|jgi:Zn-dependent protease with chaperone function
MPSRSLLLILAVSACAPTASSTLPSPVDDPRANRDPINLLAVPSLEAHAQSVLAELVAALPADKRAKVANVTLFHDNDAGDVNAYATCSTDGQPMIAVSDGLLLIAANLAQSTATDERWHTQERHAYLDWMEVHATASPPDGFYPSAYRDDREKMVRQRELFDEQLAFILGHELAHHYLGHVACGSVAASPFDGVPAFDQATELAADVAGTKNLLAAGAARAAYAWTEDGALLVLTAFHYRTPLTPKTLLFAFERTHPLPALRMPVITTTADLWRASGSLPI